MHGRVKRKYRRGRIRIVLAFICLSAAPLHGGPAEEAVTYLRQAVQEYRSGLTNKSFFHAGIAERIDPAGMKKNPDYHRLIGFLHMEGGRLEEARQSFAHSLALRPDAFLFYLTGTSNLALLPGGTIAASFREAALLPPTSVKQTGELPRGITADGTIAPAFPFRCILPGDAKRKPGEPGIEFEYLKDVFRDPLYFRTLWDHKLSRSERAVSAVIALAFLPRSDSKRTLLQGILKVDGAESVSGFRGTDAILKDPDADDPLRACISSLEMEERRLVSGIQNGNLDLNAQILTVIRAEIRRVHRFRSLRRGTLESMVAYGTYLLRERDGIGALHVFRRALYRLDRDGPAFSGEHGSPRHMLSSKAMLYRQLSSAYRLLGRFGDERTTGDFATHLDGVLITAETNMAEVNAGLVASSLQNLKSREGLLVLLAHGPASRKTEFQKKLRDRDKDMDMQERLSAFRDYD